MKKTKEMFAGGFYILKGESSANSSFIEDKEEAMKFIEECNKRLLGFAKIHDYLLTKDGWVLLISLLDEKTIKSSYLAKWKQSNRVKKESFLTLSWKIISEQIRQIRFTFVLYSNRKNGREGSKVKRSYERFWFETVQEAQDFINQMKNQLIKLVQKKKTYRSKKSHFRIPESIAKGAVFLCSLRVEEGDEVRIFGVGSIEILCQSIDVLRSLIKTTILLHKNQNDIHLHPKIE